MENIMVVVLILMIAGSAAWYLYKAKKRGETCIGCPYAKQCKSNSCSCGSVKEPKR